MLTTRVLPVAEWSRLQAIEPFASAGLPQPEHWMVLVVERDGVLVGTCSLFTAVHWDCWWVDPAARGKGGVLRALLQRAVRELTAADVDTAYTGVAQGDADVARLLGAFGFTPAAGSLFVLDVPAARQRLEG